MDSIKQKQGLEIIKRKRELVLVVVIGILFSLFTWAQYILYDISHRLPFLHSIFFFGLVNLNIVLLLFLLFLIFRNVVKVFVERKGRLIGSSLKSKLIAAFVAFSFIPTILMLVISLFYIQSSFDKWFSDKVKIILKDSLEITNNFYVSEKRRNYHFAEQIAEQLNLDKNIKKQLQSYLNSFSLDAVEYYPDLFEEKVYAIGDANLSSLPNLSLEFLQKAISDGVESSTLHQFGQGNLVRAMIPVRFQGQIQGAIVVSSFVPIALTSKMDDIAIAYDNFKDLDPLEYPVKSIYVVILILMTLVILLGASWFGFHLAKELSVPLVQLSSALEQIPQGNYSRISLLTGSSEMQTLIDSFNQMTKTLEQSEGDLKQANTSLQDTLSVLDEHNRYIEVVLSKISTGVISIDRDGYITTVNQEAERLLNIIALDLLGTKFSSSMDAKLVSAFEEMRLQLQSLKSRFNKDSTALSVKKEILLPGKEDTLQLMATLNLMLDEKLEDLGLVLVLDDLSVIANAQRAAAWREVARRIAHEIKNPLTPIKLSAQRLQNKFGEQIPDPAFASCTEMIIKQVDQLKTMVNEFSNFARMPEAKFVRSSLQKCIKEAVDLFENSNKSVEFVLDLDSSMPEFEFDPGQISRVFVNIIDNSISSLESMGDALHKKQIQIETKYDAALKIARISIADNGKGLGSVQLSRVFEPYYTTKEHGTGLGLAIVKRIVQDHNAFIRASHNSPQGLKMLIEMPVESKVQIKS